MPLKVTFGYRPVFIGIVFGLLVGGLTLSYGKLESMSENPVIATMQKTAIILTFPGMVGSIEVSGNVHVFSTVVAAVINTILYFVVGSLSAGILKRSKRPKTL
jgi:hypothetical protein